MSDQSEQSLQKPGGPQMTPEMLRNTHDIAAQAAQRAQQMLRKSIDPKIPPDVPARGDSNIKAPEIPPKRMSLKQLPNNTDDKNMIQKPPPPLPQKPNSSSSSSPNMMPKFQNSPQLNARAPATPQLQPKFEKFIPQQGSPQVSLKFSEKLSNSPQFAIKNNQSSPQFNQRPASTVAATTNQSSLTNSPQMNIKPVHKAPIKVPSPTDDFSSVDALRGIESGLRNMERAMQEQLNMRSMEAAAAAAQHKIDNMTFNPVEFKNNIRSLGGSIGSLDGSSQNMKAIENIRMSMNQQNMRSMERGFSMDQMRLDLQLGGGGNVRSMDSNPNLRSTIEEIKMKGMIEPHSKRGGAPVENHMRSLDRNLPLELQYSRHRQQDNVVDFRDQIRQMGRPSGGVSREDLRIRRRSSHDENQISQAVPGNF